MAAGVLQLKGSYQALLRCLKAADASLAAASGASAVGESVSSNAAPGASVHSANAAADPASSESPHAIGGSNGDPVSERSSATGSGLAPGVVGERGSVETVSAHSGSARPQTSTCVDSNAPLEATPGSGVGIQSAPQGEGKPCDSASVAGFAASVHDRIGVEDPDWDALCDPAEGGSAGADSAGGDPDGGGNAAGVPHPIQSGSETGHPNQVGLGTLPESARSAVAGRKVLVPWLDLRTLVRYAAEHPRTGDEKASQLVSTAVQELCSLLGSRLNDGDGGVIDVDVEHMGVPRCALSRLLHFIGAQLQRALVESTGVSGADENRPAAKARPRNPVAPQRPKAKPRPRGSALMDVAGALRDGSVEVAGKDVVALKRKQEEEDNVEILGALKADQEWRRNAMLKRHARELHEFEQTCAKELGSGFDSCPFVIGARRKRMRQRLSEEIIGLERWRR